MRVVFVASEASPLAKVGGLADVIGSLPLALIRAGHDVRVMIPQYGSIDTREHRLTTIIDKIDVPMFGGTETASISTMTLRGKVPVYLIGSSKYFSEKSVYSANDLNRFLFFSKAVAEILPKLDWQAQVVHCHDWHAALTVMWLKKNHYPAPIIFTIHNLAYQGWFDENFLKGAGLAQDWNSPPGAPTPPYNYLGQGILWADFITTVSENYAREILTPEYGAGLDPLLRHREGKLTGILNGIDCDEYNPESDPNIPASFSWANLDNRPVNKAALQKGMGLPEDASVPLIGMVQRLVEQKGFDIFEKALPTLLEVTKAQVVALGEGTDNYEKMLHDAAARYPRQVAGLSMFNEALAHLIYSGSDMFLMPSRYEPCGLGQLIAMRYGSVPIVRHTGGLIDTVSELSPDFSEGSGFVFHDYTPEALLNATKRSTDAFNNKAAWKNVVQRIMRLDFSWDVSSAKYLAVYRRILGEVP